MAADYRVVYAQYAVQIGHFEYLIVTR